jgi:hypothetical protein
MATTVVSGEYVMVFISPATGSTTWKAVAHATSHTLDIAMAARDTSNKGTANYTTSASGRLDVSGTIQGLYIDNDKYNLEDFMTLILARNPVLMIFGKETVQFNGVPDTTTSGLTHFYASGQFIITNLSQTQTDQQNGTYTVTFKHFTGFQMNKLITS